MRLLNKYLKEVNQMNKIANLPKEQRRELFTQSPLKMNTTNAIIEKDFWVVWVLDKIFADSRLNKILMFKGGTSLSKVLILLEDFQKIISCTFCCTHKGYPFEAFCKSFISSLSNLFAKS